MADDEVTPLSTPTTNYGWAKPAVGGDADAWGGMLNTDLDGIDSTVKSVSNVANAAYPASNPSGYIVDAPSDGTAYLRSNAIWASGGTLSGTLAVGVGSATVNALTITPGANPANANPAQINASNLATGVLINGAWQLLKSGGQALMFAQGNGSLVGIGQGSPNNMTFQNNGQGGVFVLMDQTSANVNPGNYLQILNAPLGNPATAIIQTAGGSTNRGIQLVPNGTGTVQAPTMAATDSSTAVATTAFVHAAVIGDNRIINGDFRIDQRNAGASGTAVSVYTVDRWQYNATQASKGTWGRANFGAFGFPYALNFGSSSAYTPLAGDTFYFVQPIEADMVSDFQWGTAGAQPVTLSFIAMSSLTGIFGGSIQNAANTRSYPFTFSLPVASTATRISITIPGDTAGAWVTSGNAASTRVIFDLGTGATYRGPAGAWAAAFYNGVPGAVNVVGTNAATFYVTGVKLEIGSVATPFNRQSLAKSMSDCQRYYQISWATARFLASAAGANNENSLNYQLMRAAPTTSFFLAGTSGNLNAGFPQALQVNPAGMRWAIQSAAAGDCYALNFALGLDAEL